MRFDKRLAWSAVAAFSGGALIIFAPHAQLLSAQSTGSPSTYSLYTGTDVKVPPPTPTIGGANTVFVDPDYLSKILRVTDQNTAAGMSFIPTDAGFTRTFNANSTAIKLQDPTGWSYWEEFSPANFKVGDGSATPQPHKLTAFDARWEWSAVNPAILYYLTGSSIASYNITTGASTILASTPNGDPTTYHVAVIGQDLWVCSAAGAGIQDTYTELFCVNPSNTSQTKFINVPGATINGVAQSSPNWPTSASGQTLGVHSLDGAAGGPYLEVTFHQQSWGANGDSVLNLSTNTWSLLTNGDVYWSGHVSVGNGRLVNGGGSVDDRDSRGAVVRDPDDLMNQSKYMFIMQPPSTCCWNDGEHSSWFNSSTNPNAPVLFSRYTITSSPWLTWMSEIILAATDGSNTVWRVAHTHQNPGCYYGDAFAQISNDGNWALFSTTWDGTLGSQAGFDCATRVDTFIVALNGAGSTSPTPPTPPPPPAPAPAPSVAVTAPAAGATVGGTATVTANASSSIGIAGVQFQLDGANLGAQVTATPYALAWSTSSASNGSHSLTAIATDTAGNATTSAPVAVTVSNTAPTPPPPPPSGGSTGSSGSSGSTPSAGAPTVPVTWTGLANDTVTGTTLQKTGGCDGCPDATAISSQSIGSGDGFLQVTASETATMRVIGLATGTPGTNLSAINFAINLQAGDAEVEEKGSYRADVPFVTGDVFQIAIIKGKVTYLKNGTAFYTSTVAPAYPLRAVALLYNLNATLTNVVMTVAPTQANVTWTNLDNAIVVLGVLRKAGGCDGCQDGGANSTQTITGGDGYVQFTVPGTGPVEAIGLTTSTPGTTLAALNFALEFNSGIAQVMENGVYKADVKFKGKDTFRVAVSGGIVAYSHNGTVFYTSTTLPSYPLVVGTSLLSSNGAISNAVIFGVLGSSK